MMNQAAGFPVIAITGGEPAGIGTDIILQAAQYRFDARLCVISDPDLLRARATQLNIAIDLVELNADEAPPAHVPGKLYVHPTRLNQQVECGTLNPANASYVLKTLRLAGEGCLSGRYHALVTPPVHKGIICEAGPHFSGHTEYFQELCQSSQVVMMLATEKLRVALATTHLPLKDVAQAITKTGLKTVLRTLHNDLQQRFAIDKPRILVCGLNPHAGENGHLGMEEIETIIPALSELKKEGLHLTGPLPADTLFTPKYLEQADAVLAMYHDQGLPVLKYQGFGRAVNITLGLPIIRTSVDHGTALDLAGTGLADEGSLVVAINQAIDMAKNTRTNP